MSVQHNIKQFQRYRRAMKRFLWFVMSCCMSLILSQPWFPLWNLSIHEMDQFIVLDSSKAIAATPPEPKPEPRVQVAEVVVQGVTGELQDIAYKTLTLKPGGITTKSELQTEINNLFATGWFSNVQAEPKDTPKGVRVTFIVKTNPILKQVSLNADPDRKSIVPENIVNEIFRSQYGKLLNFKTLQTGVTQLSRWYTDNGYSLAQITSVPGISENGMVTIKVSEGLIEAVRVRFKDSKDVEVKEGKTPISLIIKSVETKPGQLFQRSQILADLQRLSTLSIFSDVKTALEVGKNPENAIVIFDVVEMDWKRERLVGTVEATTKAAQDLQHARERKDPIAEAKALRFLAGIQSDIEKYKTALKLSQTANDRFGEAEAHRGLALIYYNNLKSDDKDEVKKEKRKQSIASYETALKIYRELKNDLLSAIVLRNMGFLYQELEDYGAAIDVYEKALPLFETLNRPFWKALTLSNLASSYREFNDPDKSIIAHQKALLTLRNLNRNPNQLGTTSFLSQDSTSIGPKLGSLSVSFKYSDLLGTQGEVNFYTATDYFRKESIFDAQKLEVITLINIAGSYQAVGDYQQALYTFKDAFPDLKISPDVMRMLIQTGGISSQQDGDMFNDGFEMVESFFMSRIYAEMGDKQTAKAYFDRVFMQGNTLAEKLWKIRKTGTESDNVVAGVVPIWASFFSSIFSRFDSNGSKDQIDLFIYDWVKSSIPTVQKLLDKNSQFKSQIQSYLPLIDMLDNYFSGYSFAKGKKFQQSTDAYQKVLKQWETVQWGNLSSIQLKTDSKDFSGAIGTFGDLIDQLQEVYYAKVHTDLSASLLALGKPSEALSTQQKALQILEANILKKAVNQSKASSFIDIFTKKIPDTTLAEALHQLGKSYAANQQYDLALQSFNRALPVWKRVDELLKEADTEWEMAIVQRKQGNLTQAKTQIESAIDRIESEKAQLEEQKKQEENDKKVKKTAYKSYLKLADYLASKHNYYAFYIDLLMQLHQQSPNNGYEELAFQASERSHARSLRAMLGRSNQKKNVPSDKPQVFQLAQTLSLQDIQQQILDDKTILLEYALGQDKSYLWAVTNTGLKTYVLPKQADIETAARQLIGLLKSRDYQFGDREALQDIANSGEIDTATYLSKMLLGNVADQLENKRLLIVANGILHYLPFAALPKPGKESIPMIIDHEIIGLPSASMGASFQKRRNTGKTFTKDVIVLADPIFTRDDDRLPNRNTDAIEKLYKRLEGTREEATKIAALSPERSFIRLDGEASRQLMMNTDLNQYRMVHIASHGVLNSQNPARSGMVLSTVDPQGELQRGLLSAADAFNLKLSSDLVVLSGCTTALGKEIQGEGLIGMTGGLMYSGSQQVAAGLWDVDDDGTALLMTQFYQGMLKQALSPAAALRSAQINLFKSQNWKAPYYWSAFTLQGR